MRRKNTSQRKIQPGKEMLSIKIFTSSISIVSCKNILIGAISKSQRLPLFSGRGIKSQRKWTIIKLQWKSFVTISSVEKKASERAKSKWAIKRSKFKKCGKDFLLRQRRNGKLELELKIREEPISTRQLSDLQKRERWIDWASYINVDYGCLWILNTLIYNHYCRCLKFRN